MDTVESKKSKKSGAATREELIAAIRAAVEAQGGEAISYEKFLVVAKMTPRDVWRNFTKWTQALKAAGFQFKPGHRKLESAPLLADWGRVARELGRLPTMKEYEEHGNYNMTTLARRFEAWTKVPVAFREFAEREQLWGDVLKLFPDTGLVGDAARGRGWKRGLHTSRFAKVRLERIKDRPLCGIPMYFEGMSHAPVNEAGVVLLFGVMAAKLGFTVESMRAEFPDCVAKRRLGPDILQTVRIEFEYESRNFRQHRHPVDGCDYIVCWAHNWPDCPAGLKVIALREEVVRLRREACAERGAVGGVVLVPGL